MTIGQRFVAALVAFGAALVPCPGHATTGAGPLSASELKQIDSIVGSRKQIVFGEDAHRLPSINRLVAQLFRQLVETQNVRVLVFESAWGVEDALADFMSSERTALSGREPFFLNAFASPETAGLLVWIRDWNRAHPQDKVRISGFQPEQPVTDFSALQAGLKANGSQLEAIGTACGFADQYKTDIDYIVAISSGGADAPLQTGAARLACAAAIDELREAMPLQKGAARELALHAYSLSYYVQSVAAAFDEKPDLTLSERSAAMGRDYDAVDAARLHVFDELLKTRYGGMKTFFWMHNWHAARHASEIETVSTLGFGIPKGTISFGERLHQRDGRTVAYLGTVVPCPATGGCTEPAGGVETVLKTRFGDAPAIIRLAKTHDPAFSKPSNLMSNSNKMELRDVVLARQFDGLIYLPAEK